MFRPETLAEQFGLTLNYHNIRWSTPPVMPESIMFVDDQDVLYYGILYVAGSEAEALDFLSRDGIKIYPGAILCVACASEQIPPALSKEEGVLSIIGVAEKPNRIFNRFLAHGKSDPGKKRLFGDVWREIISNPSLTAGEIRHMIEKFPELGNRFFQIAVVSFHSRKNIPYQRIASQLKSLISGSCALVDNKEIILLITYEVRRFSSNLDNEQITTILEEFDGWMTISNGSSKLSDIRIIYELTHRINQIVYTMKLSQSRVYDAGDYGLYGVIDMAHKAFQTTFANENDLILLAHPAAVILMNYDYNHGDNLLEVLYQYLFHDRNVTKTSKVLFMHRNTIINKIRKINSILGIDLDNCDIRHMLLLSCQMLRYVRDVPQQSIRIDSTL